jgi:hypothetical protein
VISSDIAKGDWKGKDQWQEKSFEGETPSRATTIVTYGAMKASEMKNTLDEQTAPSLLQHPKQQR